MKNIQFMLIQLLFRPFSGDGFIMGLSQSLTKAARIGQISGHRDVEVSYGPTQTDLV